ncbi:DUF6222 family protein [Amycolatopsis tolypomycina]|uniref:Uncharacterized protein n=1 Tax=Amycolatopsis tolypomycina TaxID=208445 RepID=A0A1H5A0J5_9PSEU|nr:DUF6222 family protein [Amycolatopsis tolypomycina]SED35264.1 hypothetical protein SAMN04489727_7526 [Amycolatopsis tolypomycina]
MTAHEETDDTTRPVRAVPDPPAEPVVAAVPAITRPMPRLGRGIVWSMIVAEIEQDNLERLGRLRDAA